MTTEQVTIDNLICKECKAKFGKLVLKDTCLNC